MTTFPIIDSQVVSTPGEMVPGVYVIATGVKPAIQEIPSPMGEKITISQNRETPLIGIPFEIVGKAGHILMLDGSLMGPPMPPNIIMDTSIFNVVEVNKHYFDTYWNRMSDYNLKRNISKTVINKLNNQASKQEK